MLHSLAVTTDFSDASRESFPAAAALARKFDAQLYVLHVTQDPQIVTAWQMASAAPAELQERSAALEKKLGDLVQCEPAFAKIRVHHRLLPARSAEAVHEFTLSENIDLVLIATHGYWGIKHFLLGSFTAKVLQLVSCPILVFRVLKGEEGKSRPPFHPCRILIPFDFSQPSGAALDIGRAWAKAFDASVRILHVIDPQAGVEGHGIKEGDAAGKEKLKASALEHLLRLIARDWEAIPAKASAREGSPAMEILREAEEFRPDLIVIASRGLSVLDSVTLGSVAERTIQGAPCPVLVVRACPKNPPGHGGF